MRQSLWSLSLIWGEDGCLFKRNRRGEIFCGCKALKGHYLPFSAGEIELLLERCCIKLMKIKMHMDKNLRGIWIFFTNKEK